MYSHYIWDFDGNYLILIHKHRAFQQALSDLGYSHTSNEILSHLKISVSTCIKYYQENTTWVRSCVEYIGPTNVT